MILWGGCIYGGKITQMCVNFSMRINKPKFCPVGFFYGRLLSTLDDDDLEILQDPKVALSEEEKRALERIAEESGQAMRKITGTVRVLRFFFGSCLMTLAVGHG